MTQGLCTAVAAHVAVSASGGKTKNLLHARVEDSHACRLNLDLTAHAGIVTYDPSEFLITARTGTRISDLASALEEHGQYLPFDPVLMTAGATLGGTIASGFSGANRLFYGSLRDFVMEVELIDGLGRLVRGGGKVVKNSAGFDLPKLMVGSYGRLGILTEATLKVFPKPSAYVTQRFDFDSTIAVLAGMQKLQTNPLPISALEIEPPGRLVVRFAGRAEALTTVAIRAGQLLEQGACDVEGPAAEAMYWTELSEFAFMPPGSTLIRVAMSGRRLVALDLQLQELQQVGSGLASYRYSGGGSVAWLAVSPGFDYAELDRRLSDLGLAGIVARNQGIACEGLQLLGQKSWVAFSERIRLAMDPAGKFPSFVSL